MKRIVTTINLPETLLKQIPARNRSEYVETALIWVINQTRQDPQFAKQMRDLRLLRRDSLQKTI